MNSSSIPNVPSLVVGGRVFTDLKNLKVIHFQGGTNTNNTPRLPATASGYTPSGSKAFRILVVELWSVASAIVADVGYADNDIGLDSATAFVNSKGIFGTALGAHGSVFYNNAGLASPMYMTPNLLVPNTKYPAIWVSVTSAVYSGRLYGYEE